MRLFSRSTGGRRGAKMAAVFAGTLLTYLVVTAIPAFAATTCAAGSVAGQTILNVGTDDNVLIVDNAAADLQLSINGGALGSCTGVPLTEATLDWLDVRGSDAGNETFVIHAPEDSGTWDDWTTTVDLGNGSDKLVFEYGAVPGLGLAEDPSQFIGMRQSGSSIAVDVTGAGTSAEIRIDDAENLAVNGGTGVSGLCASRTPGFPGCDVDLTTQPVNLGTTTGDDIALPATDPIAQDATLNGGAGDDVLASGDGNDNFLGGPGTDVVDYWSASQGVTVDLAAATGTGMGNDTLADVQDANGSLFDDTIIGNGLDNVLNGRDGDDHIDGAAGNDTVDGQADDDHVMGGPGNDTVNGGADDDVLVEDAAANGADVLNGGADYDVLDYSARTNPLYVEHGGGAVSGEGGCPAAATCEDDNVTASFEEFWLGSGDDEFVGAGVDEWIVPGAGDDVVDGNGGTDMLDLSTATTDVTVDLPNGTANGDGNDTFEDIESVATGSGNDTVLWDGLAPLVDFISDGGTDTVDASQAVVDVTIDLATFGDGKEVEDAIGGAGDDDIYGNEMGNALWGGDGNDWIDGRFGNDWVEGGAGNDAMIGGPGADTLSYMDAPNGVIVDNQLGFGAGHGDDAITFFEIVLGSDFGDEIIAGQTFIDANQRLIGRGGDDVLIGSNSSDLIKGGKGNDNIRGGQGDDDLVGAAGDDYLSGSGGDDFLRGGKGTDTGKGGKGDDVCKGVEFPKSC